MGGISGSGLISGIDTASLINQLIAVSSGPKTLAQGRLVQLRAQQAAYLDLNSQLGSLRTAAQVFRTESVFKTKKATSSNTDVLTATASTGAQPGTYSFIVDRLVSSRQLLSRGFQDTNTSAIGATAFTFESSLGRLDRDLSLSELNNGEGIVRGKIRISDGTNTADIDLSRAANVSDVLDRINGSGLEVTASVRDGAFRISGAVSVANVGTADTARSLGLIGAGAGVDGSGVYQGVRVYGLSGNVTLNSLNDGNGVDYNSRTTVTSGAATDFRITVGGVVVNVGLGNVWGDDGEGGIEIIEPPVNTVAGLIGRINTAFADAGVDATASIDVESGAIKFDSSAGNITAITQVGNARTVRDLGLDNAALGGASVTSARIFSGMGTTLLRGLNGGGASGGMSGDGVINIQTRAGNLLSIDLSAGGFDTVEGLIDYINNHGDNNNGAGGTYVTASLNQSGTGLRITDETGGTGNLIITGTDGADTAASLGVSTGPDGVARRTVQGSSLQRRYISEATLLSSLRNGDGIGTGQIRLVDASGRTADVTIGSGEVTIADLIAQIRSQIDSRGLELSVGINATGDGIEIADTSGSGSAIRIEDISGSVASNLRIAGTAEGSGDENRINGSFEVTVTFDPTDTLQDMVSKINNARAGVAVSILNDGTGARPYRLSITARETGAAGRFTIDTHGFDMGIEVLDRGEDARVFFGSSDPASAILLTSSTNTLDNVITGVNIDLNSVSDEPVRVTVTEDSAGIESKIEAFIEAYNRVIASITRNTRFDADTGERGALLGDGLLLGLRGGLFNTIQSTNLGFSNAFDRLTDVGIKVGREGKLEFDKDRFREAITQNPAAVEALFTRRTLDTGPQDNSDLPDGVTATDPNARDRFSELGVIARIEEFARNYVDSIDGVFASRNRSLDSQILNQQRRIDRLQQNLDRQRATLESQFVAMERALAQLQSQQFALSSVSLIG